MKNDLKFMSIETVKKLKDKYARKACIENGTNERTNEIVWYASYAIHAYENMGLKINIKKDIEKYRQTIGEMELNFKEEIESIM